MTTFEKWEYFYNNGWASEEDLREVVEFGILTESEYEQITGDTY